MPGRILLPGELGSQFEPALTWEGLNNLITDLRNAGERVPAVIVVSEYERRDLNQEILAHSTSEVSKEDRREDHDGQCIGFIAGVMIRSHVDVPRGKARFLYPAVRDDTPLPSGKIISLGSL